MDGNKSDSSQASYEKVDYGIGWQSDSLVAELTKSTKILAGEHHREKLEIQLKPMTMSKKKTQLCQSFLISIIQIQKNILSLKKLIEMKIMTEDKGTCHKEYLL